MSKKDKVMDATDVNSVVDFRFTKDDLTTMIIEEQLELYENRVDELEKHCKVLFKSLTAAQEAHEEAMITVAKNNLAKPIKQAEKLLGISATYEIRSKQIEILPYEDIEYILYRVNSSGGRTKRKETTRIKSVFSYTEVTAIVYNGWDLEGGIHAHGELRFFRKFTNKELEMMPTLKHLKNADIQYRNAVKELKAMVSELSNIQSSGNRARAKMVRSLLDASDQGKQLLKLMPKVNTKLLAK